MNPADRQSDSPRAPHAPLLDRTLVRAFLDNIPDCIYFKDRESRFIAVSASKARRHNLKSAELVGLSDFDVFSEEHAQWARVDEENIMNTGVPVLGKLEKLDWPDGRTTWTEVTKLPLRDETGEIIGTFGISHDVSAEQEMGISLEKARRELVDTSRKAGMAEVATGVLHNIGNVLTSLNVSSNMIATSLQQSKADSLARFAALLQQHEHDLGTFVTEDPKGRRVTDFLETLAQHAVEERDQMVRELQALQESIDHVKEIVSMQQAYATMVGVVEPLDPATMMEDALRMNAAALVRHQVAVVREFHPTPRILAEKAKVLQILVNLIRNAKYACDEGGHPDKTMVLRLEAGEDHVRFVVSDNGVGIAAENLPRLFQHGFTTRKEGHGFGLHSAVNAATEMRGTLTACSGGPGQGATFTLKLPTEAAARESSHRARATDP